MRKKAGNLKIGYKIFNINLKRLKMKSTKLTRGLKTIKLKRNQKNLEDEWFSGKKED